MFSKSKYTRHEVTVSLGLKLADQALDTLVEQTVEFGVQARFNVAEVTRRIRDDKELRVKSVRDFGVTFQTWKVPLERLKLSIVDGYVDVSAACALLRQELVTAGHITPEGHDEVAGAYITGSLEWAAVIDTLRAECPFLGADVVIRTVE